MQIPEVLQYFDIGARGGALVLLTYLSIRIKDLSTRVQRIEEHMTTAASGHQQPTHKRGQ